MKPAISIVLVNWNAAQWVPRCVESLRRQTIFPQVEIIFVDNHSTDDSWNLAKDYANSLTNFVSIQAGFNAGFGAAGNLGSKVAHGKYLLVINPDTHFKDDCLEQLLKVAESSQAVAVAAKVMNYASYEVQSTGDTGFNIFGGLRRSNSREKFSCGSFPFILATEFFRLGGFDEKQFLYGEEEDLAWRINMAGGKIVAASNAIIHHEGAVTTSSKKFRPEKRFYANRNHVLNLLKNASTVLVVSVVLFVAIMFVEACYWISRLDFKTAYASSVKALAGCWKLRGHVREKRRQNAQFRKRNDFWMMRKFLKIP